LADNLSHRALALTSSVVNLVSCLLLVPLISLSHTASPSPSLLPGSYLFLTLVLDLAQARSLFLRSSSHHLPPPLPVVFALSLATKAALVVAEELPKLPKSDPSAKLTGPESLSGAINRTLFWWLNHLFLRGYRSLIAATDLDTIPARFNSDRLLKEISPLWDERVGDGEKKEPGKHAFAMTVLGGFWVWIAAAVPPRLARTGFMYSQILLMKRVILFIEEAGRGAVVGEGEEGVKREDLARGLIGATVLVYVGIAVAECVHKQLIFRLVTMIRGAVTSMIYQKTVRLEDKSLGDAAPVTLMACSSSFSWFSDPSCPCGSQLTRS
jgi:ATP-binding cassette, subfamily C (CFTR/MRP), member 1